MSFPIKASLFLHHFYPSSNLTPRILISEALLLLNRHTIHTVEGSETFYKLPKQNKVKNIASIQNSSFYL
jgi:uncharacterized protein YecE (DUF72 family)